MEKCFQEF